MIEFENKGKIVLVEYDEVADRYVFKTARDMTVEPKEPCEVKTKVTVKFSHLLDELVILNETNDALPLCAVSDAYVAEEDEGKEVVLTMFFNGTKTLQLKKGDILAYAKCYHRCVADSPYLLPEHEKDMPIVYVDDTLRIQSVTGEQVDIETVTEPNGNRYVKIPLPKLTADEEEPAESEEVDE